MSTLEQEQLLKQKMQLIYFLSVMKLQNQTEDDGSPLNFYSEEFVNYKNKLQLVSEKIHQWHDELRLQRQVEFENDAEFLESVNSPTEFFQQSSEGSEEDLLQQSSEY